MREITTESQSAQVIFLTYLQKFTELVLLYKGKGLHRNALELLSRLVNSLYFSKYSLSQGSKGGTNGVAETINYLKELGKEHLGLVLEFSRWLLQTSPEQALVVETTHLPIYI